ncbi:hypothetical protein [Flavobacterium sp.]|uniref:hypothetical protein n=1 Tax=Flavobacterium sp. TaxID=239 RepID=UPI0025BBE552|nr:hypothetical protein [Flavobacterium sp.]
MNFKTSILSAFAIAFVTVSCKKELEPQESSVPLTQTDAAAAPTAQNAVQPQQIQPGQQQMQVQPQQVQQVQQPQATAPGMNPPHGQPGHRCDIPVGSSLSQPVKTAATPTTATPGQAPATITKVNPATAATAVKTAPGMNPPHGQPGHRCDIAVGAPLNSAPPKPTSIQTANGNNSDPVTITPAVINSNGTVTPGSGVKITTSQSPASSAPALLQDPNSK